MNRVNFSSVIALMEEVGQKILSWRSNAHFRQLHSEVDFKTEADRRAHDLICNGLIELFPGIEIISEESPEHFSIRPDKYWLIDPIDGTASWYHGFDGFVTQAAYIEYGVPFFGVVCAPALRKTWVAVQGEGASLNGELLPALTSNQRLIITDNTSVPHGVAEDVADLLHATGYFECGSIGLKCILVADGTVDLFVKDVCVRDWDIAPAAVVIKEVGAQLCLSNGSPYIFDGIFEKKSGFIVARDLALLTKSISAFAKSKK